MCKEHAHTYTLMQKLHQPPVYLSTCRRGGRGKLRERESIAKGRQALQSGITLPVASSIMGDCGPDGWEAAGKERASLHQTDVLKVSNQCSLRALLLWQSTPPPLFPCIFPPSFHLLSCLHFHGGKASPPHCISGAVFYPA